MNTNTHQQKNRGYTLLFAILIASIVLGVALSILSISKREFLLSTSARESQHAFYAADTGIECAVYNDYVPVTFESTSTPPESITCTGKTYPITTIVDPTNTESKYKFTYLFNIKATHTASDSACAIVEVVKELETTVDGTVSTTTIDSWGYNYGYTETMVSGTIATSTCEASNQKKVERSLHLTY